LNLRLERDEIRRATGGSKDSWRQTNTSVRRGNAPGKANDPKPEFDGVSIGYQGN